MKKLKDKLNYPILKQPPEIKKMKAKIIIFSIISSGIIDMLSFTIKLAKTTISEKLVLLTILLLVFYYSSRVIESIVQTFQNLQDDIFNEIYQNSSISIILALVNTVKDKVFKKAENGNYAIMEEPELISKSKKYVSAVWNFYWNIPIVITNTLILIAMTISILYLELKDSSSSIDFIILAFLILCITIYFLLGFKRIKMLKRYRKTKNENEAKNDKLMTDIYTVSFLDKQDFNYHASLLKTQLSKTNDVNKIEHRKLNHLFILRSVTAALFMISIIVLEFFSSETFNEDSVFNIIALATVYSTILQKITSIVKNTESLTDNLLDIDSLSDDFEEMIKVYDEENTKIFVTSSIDFITVNPFEATRDQKKVYKLINNQNFNIMKGDIILIDGPTGCGKSTLIELITGKLRVQGNPLKFSNGEFGYLQSIAYKTDSSLANNIILNEIILSTDYTSLDEEKLLKILKGLCLYEDLLKFAQNDFSFENLSNDKKVIEVLKLKYSEQFSSGQKQRLALAKLLYTMQEEQRVIALDEAFNRLDDYTAKKCVEFIISFINTSDRILLLATHQVTIVRPFCNKEITFEEKGTTSIINVTALEN